MQLPCGDLQVYHATVLWGNLSDCSSWQPPPQWSKARNSAPTVSPLAPSIGSASLPQRDEINPAQQSLTLAAADEALQDQPCVLPVSEMDSVLHAPSADRANSICQQQADTAISAPSKAHTVANGKAFISAPPPDGSHRKSRQNAACYRLHVACTAAVSGPVHINTPVSTAAQHSLMHRSIASGLSYHVPPRLSRYC